MSSITPLSAEAIAKKLENEYQNAALSSLTAVAGAAIGVFAAHGPQIGVPTVVLGLISTLLVFTGALFASRCMASTREYLPVPRSKEIAIQDMHARQSAEIREYLETAQRTRGGLVAQDLAIIDELAARKPEQVKVRPLVS